MVAPLTARAIKATALREETLMLLRGWRPGESARAFVRRATDENLLGKATAARTADVIRHAFVHRLLASPSEEPATTLRALIHARSPGPWFDAILVLAAARADPTIYATAAELLPVLAQRQRSTLTTADLERFLTEAMEQGRMARPWSTAVIKSVAQHVLGLLGDFGLLSAPRRGSRAILPFRPGELATAWLACDLRRRGLSDAEIPIHADWGVWQMPEATVRAELDRLARLGLWIYQEAAGVTRFNWRWTEWAEVVARLGEANLV